MIPFAFQVLGYLVRQALTSDVRLCSRLLVAACSLVIFSAGCSSDDNNSRQPGLMSAAGGQSTEGTGAAPSVPGGLGGSVPAAGGTAGAVGYGGAVTGAGGFSAGGATTSSGGAPPGSGGASTGGAEIGAGGATSEADGGAGGSPTSANCGTRTSMRGKTSRTIMVGNARRTFIAYLPQSADPSTPVPLVYVFHGATQTGQALYDMTEYAKLADEDGIAVVFPDGQGASSATGVGSLTPWHVSDAAPLCGLGTLVSNPNAADLNFIDAIKEEMLQDQCIDDAHVFVTGFSMGGYLSHYLACNRPEFAAAGPHSGGTMANLTACKTARMPIIVFHGNADPLINEGCSDPKGTLEPGFPASPTLWAQRNGCQETYTTVPQDGMNGMNGSCYLYDGCPADGQVEVCIFNGLPHAWAGAPVCAGCIGSGAGFASATRIEWEFFKKYAW